MTKLLEVKNLKTYFTISQGVVRAVDDASFDLDYGEALYWLESPAAARQPAHSLYSTNPAAGRRDCWRRDIAGRKNLAAMDGDEIRKYRWNDISICFQGAMNALNPVLKIGKQIAEAIMLHQGLDEKAALDKAAYLLELVDIPGERINNYPHEFSGGMKQRVMIAMALAYGSQDNDW